MEIFEFDDAVHHTAQALCKVICVSSFHFVWEGENYSNTVLVHACLFVRLIVRLFCFVLFCFSKKNLLFHKFPDTCRQGVRILC